MKSDSVLLKSVSALQSLFPGEDVESLPLTFAFGDPANSEKIKFEMATSFSGEESMTSANGGYDTGA
ncbi:hypothetical protein A2631_01460 [Candidatus Daviesbacteria bacterium RIFCSPHIGHO2_01_FULL_44_29]|nr:MAG: hypothetical protein A2631_01460 [Candidatus Daviesbacteria bacterium RIFCSPHIGHO2_01_FULL_44_29]OGE69923.1 MAG: hypothetical protein A3B55_00025 [Candidatus Daviesbacteria bacterium RIFCSPLOWO2_01_FULL_43_15]